MDAAVSRTPAPAEKWDGVRDCLHLGPSAYPGVRYVTPCLAGAENARAVGQHETFAPILYMMPYRTLDEAIALPNGVPQGLSSAIFTNDMREAEAFVSARQRLRNRQREPRHERRGDWRRVRRREGHRRRPRERQEGLHAPAEEHDQLSKEVPLAQGIVFEE